MNNLRNFEENKIDLSKFNAKKGLERESSMLKEALWYIFKILFFLSPLPFPSNFKCVLLRIFGSKIGEGVIIKPRVNIHFPWKLEIGSHVWIGEEVFILNFERLVIEDHVCVSQRAFLCGGNHDFSKFDFAYRNGPITLKKGCWVGASVFVAPCTIFENYAVATAGSVVSGVLMDKTIYSGNPAQAVKERLFKK